MLDFSMGAKFIEYSPRVVVNDYRDICGYKLRRGDKKSS